VFFLAENKSEYRISKSETNSKLEFPNVQNSDSMWNTIFLFWSFKLYGDSVIARPGATEAGIPPKEKPGLGQGFEFRYSNFVFSGLSGLGRMN
jgi:hypothetical protein